jgi:enamine deaminase RidA (YjgF/YER057c/UK114 family)
VHVTKADSARNAATAGGYQTPGALAHFSPVVKAGRWAFVSGTGAADLASGIAPEAEGDPASPYLGDRLELQSYHAFGVIEKLFEAVGCSLRTEVVRLEHWFRTPHPTPEDFARRRNWAEGITVARHLEARDSYIDQPRPPSVGVGITALPVEGAEIFLDLMAREGVSKQGFDAPEGVPSPPSGYSPAIRYGDYVGLAGELPTDWVGTFLTSQDLGPQDAIPLDAQPNPYFWYPMPVEDQADYVLRKQDGIARAAGTSLSRCAKATVYVGHPDDFYAVERVWKRWFPEDPPARVVIPYVGLGAKGARVEVSMELLADDAAHDPRPIHVAGAARPFGHEAQAVVAGDLLYLSTQMPVDADGLLVKSARYHPALRSYYQPAALQVKAIMQNVARLCEAAGTSVENVCKVKLLLDSYEGLSPALEELATWFPEEPPAVSAYRLGGSPLLAPDVHVLADVIVHVPE